MINFETKLDKALGYLSTAQNVLDGLSIISETAQPQNAFARDIDDLLLDMAEVEAIQEYGPPEPDSGLAWMSSQKDPSHRYTVANVLRNPQALPDTVYGGGGIYRWRILKDGTVQFSSYHSNRKAVAKATELGFQVY